MQQWKAVIKVMVIKVIKHFHTHLPPYSIILKIYFNIILYTEWHSPEILNDLNDLDLNDRIEDSCVNLFELLCFFTFFVYLWRQLITNRYLVEIEELATFTDITFSNSWFHYEIIIEMYNKNYN